MKKSLCFFLAICIIVYNTFVFTGCNNDTVKLKVYNWGDYIDKSLLDEFTEKYGIKVIYNEYATNEEMYVKLKNSRGQCDVVIPSDYMITKLVKEDLLEKIDFNNIPNYKEIDTNFKNLDFDPNNEYSVPYMWGTLGIIYNSELIKDEIKSWQDLWNPKYKGEILMLDSQRDSIGIALNLLGYSMNSKNVKELEEAKKLLIKQKDLVHAYVGDEIKDQMVEEEGAIGVVWSGDAITMMENNPKLKYVIPKEGSNLWFDNLVIPKGTKHKKEAEMFINFIIGKEASKTNCEYIGYSTPNKYTKEMLDEEIKNDSTAYPPEEVIKKGEVFVDLGDFIEEYDKIWTDIKAEQ